jgi:hypothetical protein
MSVFKTALLGTAFGGIFKNKATELLADKVLDEISGSRGGEYEDDYLIRCCAV